jgi:hypothetical protein
MNHIIFIDFLLFRFCFSFLLKKTSFEAMTARPSHTTATNSQSNNTNTNTNNNNNNTSTARQQSAPATANLSPRISISRLSAGAISVLGGSPTIVASDGTALASVRRAVSAASLVAVSAAEAMVVEPLECSVRICTWNVNGQPPPSARADVVAFNEYLDSAHDILAVGFQELSLSAESLVFNAYRQAASWRGAVEAVLRQRETRLALAPGDQLVLVGESLLVGLYLLVFVRRRLMVDVSDVTKSFVGSGLLGKLGNKGAVGVRFQLGLKTVAFACCHLAAHQHEVKRRNADYATIDAGLFPTHGAVASHDIAFFFGDMNYRLEGLSRSDVLHAVDHKRFDTLLAHDQLINEHRARRVLAGYHEPPVRFAPTYRFGVGNNIYDLERVPAYTDRILFRTDATASLVGVAELPPSLALPVDPMRHLTRDLNVGESTPHVTASAILGESIATEDAVVICVRYDSTPSCVSDHKPVVGEFVIRGERRADPTRAREFHRRADAEENAMRPQCTLSPVLLDFDQCMPLMRVEKPVTIVNNGALEAHISVAILDAPWLEVEPRDTVVAPNSSRSIQVCVCLPVPENYDVDDGTVAPTPGGSAAASFSSVLVVHSRGGGDHFVSISAQYSSNARIAASLGMAMATLMPNAPERQAKLAGLLRSLPAEARAGAIAALLTAADTDRVPVSDTVDTTNAVLAEGDSDTEPDHPAVEPPSLRPLDASPQHQPLDESVSDDNNNAAL